MNTNTRKKAISASVRSKVHKRDNGCIFCRSGRFNELNDRYGTEIMHFIGRARGGLGVERNLAEGCIYHHRQLDQADGSELRAYFREYLSNMYPDWDESELICRNRWE